MTTPPTISTSTDIPNVTILQLDAERYATYKKLAEVTYNSLKDFIPNIHEFPFVKDGFECKLKDLL